MTSFILNNQNQSTIKSQPQSPFRSKKNSGYIIQNNKSSYLELFFKRLFYYYNRNELILHTAKRRRKARVYSNSFAIPNSFEISIDRIKQKFHPLNTSPDIERRSSEMKHKNTDYSRFFTGNKSFLLDQSLNDSNLKTNRSNYSVMSTFQLKPVMSFSKNKKKVEGNKFNMVKFLGSKNIHDLNFIKNFIEKKINNGEGDKMNKKNEDKDQKYKFFIDMKNALDLAIDNKQGIQEEEGKYESDHTQSENDDVVDQNINKEKFVRSNLKKKNTISNLKRNLIINKLYDNIKISLPRYKDTNNLLNTTSLTLQENNLAEVDVSAIKKCSIISRDESKSFQEDILPNRNKLSSFLKHLGSMSDNLPKEKSDDINYPINDNENSAFHSDNPTPTGITTKNTSKFSFRRINDPRRENDDNFIILHECNKNNAPILNILDKKITDIHTNVNKEGKQNKNEKNKDKNVNLKPHKITTEPADNKNNLKYGKEIKFNENNECNNLNIPSLQVDKNSEIRSDNFINIKDDNFYKRKKQSEDSINRSNNTQSKKKIYYHPNDLNNAITYPNLRKKQESEITSQHLNKQNYNSVDEEDVEENTFYQKEKSEQKNESNRDGKSSTKKVNFKTTNQKNLEKQFEKSKRDQKLKYEEELNENKSGEEFLLKQNEKEIDGEQIDKDTNLQNEDKRRKKGQLKRREANNIKSKNGIENALLNEEKLYNEHKSLNQKNSSKRENEKDNNLEGQDELRNRVDKEIKDNVQIMYNIGKNSEKEIYQSKHNESDIDEEYILKENTFLQKENFGPLKDVNGKIKPKYLTFKGREGNNSYNNLFDNQLGDIPQYHKETSSNMMVTNDEIFTQKSSNILKERNKKYNNIYENLEKNKDKFEFENMNKTLKKEKSVLKKNDDKDICNDEEIGSYREGKYPHLNEVFNQNFVEQNSSKNKIKNREKIKEGNHLERKLDYKQIERKENTLRREDYLYNEEKSQIRNVDSNRRNLGKQLDKKKINVGENWEEKVLNKNEDDGYQENEGIDGEYQENRSSQEEKMGEIKNVINVDEVEANSFSEEDELNEKVNMNNEDIGEENSSKNIMFKRKEKNTKNIKSKQLEKQAQVGEKTDNIMENSSKLDSIYSNLKKESNEDKLKIKVRDKKVYNLEKQIDNNNNRTKSNINSRENLEQEESFLKQNEFDNHGNSYMEEDNSNAFKNDYNNEDFIGTKTTENVVKNQFEKTKKEKEIKETMEEKSSQQDNKIFIENNISQNNSIIREDGNNNKDEHLEKELDNKKIYNKQIKHGMEKTLKGENSSTHNKKKDYMALPKTAISNVNTANEKDDNLIRKFDNNKLKDKLKSNFEEKNSVIENQLIDNKSQENQIVSDEHSEKSNEEKEKKAKNIEEYVSKNPINKERKNNNLERQFERNKLGKNMNEEFIENSEEYELRQNKSNFAKQYFENNLENEMNSSLQTKTIIKDPYNENIFKNSFLNEKKTNKKDNNLGGNQFANSNKLKTERNEEFLQNTSLQEEEVFPQNNEIHEDSISGNISNYINLKSGGNKKTHSLVIHKQTINDDETKVNNENKSYKKQKIYSQEIYEDFVGENLSEKLLKTKEGIKKDDISRREIEKRKLNHKKFEDDIEKDIIHHFNEEDSSQNISLNKKEGNKIKKNGLEKTESEFEHNFSDKENEENTSPQFKNKVINKNDEEKFSNSGEKSKTEYAAKNKIFVENKIKNSEKKFETDKIKGSIDLKEKDDISNQEESVLKQNDSLIDDEYIDNYEEKEAKTSSHKPSFFNENFDQQNKHKNLIIKGKIGNTKEDKELQRKQQSKKIKENYVRDNLEKENISLLKQNESATDFEISDNIENEQNTSSEYESPTIKKAYNKEFIMDNESKNKIRGKRIKKENNSNLQNRIKFDNEKINNSTGKLRKNIDQEELGSKNQQDFQDYSNNDNNLDIKISPNKNQNHYAYRTKSNFEKRNNNKLLLDGSDQNELNFVVEEDKIKKYENEGSNSDSNYYNSNKENDTNPMRKNFKDGRKLTSNEKYGNNRNPSSEYNSDCEINNEDFNDSEKIIYTNEYINRDSSYIKKEKSNPIEVLKNNPFNDSSLNKINNILNAKFDNDKIEKRNPMENIENENKIVDINNSDLEEVSNSPAGMSDEPQKAIIVDQLDGSDIVDSYSTIINESHGINFSSKITKNQIISDRDKNCSIKVKTIADQINLESTLENNLPVKPPDRKRKIINKEDQEKEVKNSIIYNDSNPNDEVEGRTNSKFIEKASQLKDTNQGNNFPNNSNIKNDIKIANYNYGVIDQQYGKNNQILSAHGLTSPCSENERTIKQDTFSRLTTSAGNIMLESPNTVNKLLPFQYTLPKNTNVLGLIEETLDKDIDLREEIVFQKKNKLIKKKIFIETDSNILIQKQGKEGDTKLPFGEKGDLEIEEFILSPISNYFFTIDCNSVNKPKELYSQITNNQECIRSENDLMNSLMIKRLNTGDVSERKNRVNLNNEIVKGPEMTFSNKNFLLNKKEDIIFLKKVTLSCYRRRKSKTFLKVHNKSKSKSKTRTKFKKRRDSMKNTKEEMETEDQQEEQITQVNEIRIGDSEDCKSKKIRNSRENISIPEFKSIKNITENLKKIKYSILEDKEEANSLEHTKKTVQNLNETKKNKTENVYDDNMKNVESIEHTKKTVKNVKSKTQNLYNHDNKKKNTQYEPIGEKLKNKTQTVSLADNYQTLSRRIENKNTSDNFSQFDNTKDKHYPNNKNKYNSRIEMIDKTEANKKGDKKQQYNIKNKKPEKNKLEGHWIEAYTSTTNKKGENRCNKGINKDFMSYSTEDFYKIGKKNDTNEINNKIKNKILMTGNNIIKTINRNVNNPYPKLNYSKRGEMENNITDNAHQIYQKSRTSSVMPINEIYNVIEKIRIHDLKARSNSNFLNIIDKN